MKRAASPAPRSRKLTPTQIADNEALQREILSLRMQAATEINKQRLTSGLNISLGDINEEYVPDLTTIKGRMKIYERMSNDPRVRAQLRAITMTMASGVRWKVVGGKPEHRDLIESNLLRKGKRQFWCNRSWMDFVNEALGMLVYGFSMFGKVREVVDGKMIFRDLIWLHPRSVDEDGWVMDDADNLLSVRRSFMLPGSGGQVVREPVDASDLFLMCWDRRGPNWEGNAFIRPMYRPWLLGEMAEKIDIIDLQNRGVGIPVAHLSGSGGQKERDTLVAILQSLRGGDKSRAFIVLDKEESVEFLTSTGTAKDATATLAHHTGSITKAAGTEYFEQGNTATGSRAGASALATGFFINVDGIRVHLEEMINFGVGNQPGLVEELIDMNFEDVEEYPRIVGSRVSPTEQLDNIPLVQDLVVKGVIPPNIKIGNEALDRLGWPQLTPKEWDEGMASKQTQANPAFGGPGRPTVAGPDEQGRDDKESARQNMTEKKTSIDSQPSRNPASWRWLRSTTA